MSAGFMGYDEYGRPIYRDAMVDDEIIAVMETRDDEKRLISEVGTVKTELCQWCGVQVHWDGRFDHWFHWNGDVECAGTPVHKATPTTWEVAE